jgi:hypothetical protein
VSEPVNGSAWCATVVGVTVEPSGTIGVVVELVETVDPASVSVVVEAGIVEVAPSTDVDDVDVLVLVLVEVLVLVDVVLVEPSSWIVVLVVEELVVVELDVLVDDDVVLGVVVDVVLGVVVDVEVLDVVVVGSGCEHALQTPASAASALVAFEGNDGAPPHEVPVVAAGVDVPV